MEGKLNDLVNNYFKSLDKFFQGNVLPKLLREIEDKGDLLNFSKKDILAFYSSLNFTSYKSLKNVNDFIKKYFEVEGKEPYDFNEIELSDCLSTSKMYINRKDLLKIIKKHPYRNQFVVLALYEGMRGKDYCDIINAKIGDFDGSPILMSDGYYVTPSDDLIRIAHEAYNETLNAGNKTMPASGNRVMKSGKIDKRNTEGVPTRNMLVKAVFTVLSEYGKSTKTLISSYTINCINEYLKESRLTFLDAARTNDFNSYLKSRGITILRPNLFYKERKELLKKK